jgi:hypothetical protein
VDASLFVFAVDLVDTDFAGALDEIRDRSGVSGVSLATAYHHARDILPHNPVRKVYYHDGGTVLFRPEPGRYGTLVPVEDSLQRSRDVLAELCGAADVRGMTTRAWTVYLHNSRLATAHPECAPRNAYGDRYLTDLCPANQEVRRYAVALTADICRYPVRSIFAEALHFKTIDHGYHHERTFVDMGPVARFLLGLCFCDSCRRAAGRHGVDGDRLQAEVAGYLDQVFDVGTGGHDPLTREALIDVIDEELVGFLAARLEVVSTLVDEVADTARSAGVRLTYSAHGGSAKGGSTRSSDSPTEAWVLGVDLSRVAAAVDDFEILGYVAEVDVLRHLVVGYLDEIGDVEFGVGLRPMWPDTVSSTNLVDKVRVARAAGASRVDFYHYGLMPSRSLDWIGSALSG